MADNAPRNPGEPRPGGVPYYIDEACPTCGTELTLYQDYLDEEFSEDEIWYDEWCCPECEDGIHMDVPEEWMDRLKKRVDQARD